MSQRGVELFDTVLGLDIGSTSTRAFLWCPTQNIRLHIRNTKSFLKNIAQYKEGDFSSTAYPFDTDQPVYIGELIDPKRQGISLKYAFYVLVNESDHGEDNLFKQYSLVNPLRRHKDDPNFIFRLETGLRDLFSAVRKLATQQCKNRRLKITSIGLSIPSQWTLDFEDAYRRIIIDVFGVPRDGIFFHTETEALAHFLLQDHRALLLESGDEEGECDSVADYEVLLFLDFGGHNMNGCIFNVVYGKERDQNKDASFYGISEPFGAGGGSEHWAYNIGELFLRKLDRFPGYKITHRERQKQLEWFHRNKDCLGPLQELEMIDFGGDMDIDLLPEEINNCFEQSVEEILNIAKSNIEMVSQLKGVTPVVVVSGGTAKHVVIKRRLKDICSKNGIQKLRFVADLNIENESGYIARGVAYAACNRMTIEQYFRRGAAFGLQRKQNPSRGKGNPDGIWDDEASLVFSLNNPDPLEILVTGNDEFKIICDPFFELQQERGKKDPEVQEEKKGKLKFGRCYDIMEIGKLKNGRWRFGLSLRTTENQTSVVLNARREWFSSHPKEPKPPIQRHPKGIDAPGEATSVSLPLYFDGGKNCFLVDKSFNVTNLGWGPDPKPPKPAKKVPHRKTCQRKTRYATAVQALQTAQTTEVEPSASENGAKPVHLRNHGNHLEPSVVTNNPELPTTTARFVLSKSPQALEPSLIHSTTTSTSTTCYHLSSRCPNAASLVGKRPYSGSSEVSKSARNARGLGYPPSKKHLASSSENQKNGISDDSSNDSESESQGSKAGSS